MPTINQLTKKGRKRKVKRVRIPALAGSPQRSGICNSVSTTTPKKPNSALRKIVRMKLTSGYHVTAYVPGEGHNIQQYGKLYVAPRNKADLPGVFLMVIRNRKGGDVAAVENRRQGRSKYGTKKPKKNS